jgi:hypothetical protein
MNFKQALLILWIPTCAVFSQKNESQLKTFNTSSTNTSHWKNGTAGISLCFLNENKKQAGIALKYKYFNKSKLFSFNLQMAFQNMNIAIGGTQSEGFKITEDQLKDYILFLPERISTKQTEFNLQLSSSFYFRDPSKEFRPYASMGIGLGQLNYANSLFEVNCTYCPGSQNELTY